MSLKIRLPTDFSKNSWTSIIYAYVKPSQIAFPTDFNRVFSNSGLQAIKDLAGLYNSKN
jgi:hypothetical protein